MPSDGERNTRVLIFAVLCAAVGVGIAGWKLWEQAQHTEAQKRLAAERAARSQELRREANDLLRAGDWVQAEQRVLALSASDPDFDLVWAQGVRAAAQLEIPNQRQLEAAEGLIARGELAAAARAIEQVSKETAQTRRRALARAALEQKVAERLSGARGLLGAPATAEKMRALLALADDALAVIPDHKEALGYRAAAKAVLEPGGAEEVVTPSNWPDTSPEGQVSVRFAGGHHKSALKNAQRCAPASPACKVLAAQITEFEKGYANFDTARPSEVLPLFALARTIGRGTLTPMLQQVRPRAEGWMRSLQDPHPRLSGTEAVAAARLMLEFEPQHQQARDLVAENTRIAREVYLRSRAENLSREEATKILKDVLVLTLPDDEYHLKAKKRLAELRAK